MTDSETEHHVTGADLPLNFLQSVVETLDLTDVINASMTCKLWHRASLGVWQSLGQKRWTRWQTPPPPGAGHQVWKSEYARRHKVRHLHHVIVCALIDMPKLHSLAKFLPSMVLVVFVTVHKA